MFSIVIPVYKNLANLPLLLDACETMRQSLPNESEFVFVVDGSPDQSFQFLYENLQTSKINSQLIHLSRNFGSFPAIMAGLSVAKGNFVGVMAADLQEPPEFVIDCLLKLKSGDADVCLGTRSVRSDGLFNNLSSHLFWSLYRTLINPKIPRGGVDVFALNRRALETLNDLKESHTSLIGLLTWIGFKVIEVPYGRQKRLVGTSAWTLKKKINYLFDSIYAFSDLPIRLLFFIGIFGLVCSIIFSILLLALKLSGNVVVQGYSATALLITFFGSLQIFALSIIGSYTWRAYENTKRRPNFIIADRLQFKKET